MPTTTQRQPPLIKPAAQAIAALVAGILWYGTVAAFNQVQHKTVVTTGQVSLSADMTMSRAQQLALEQARAKAVEHVGGIAITSGSLIRESILQGHFVNTLSHGYIIEETILDWQSDWRAAASPDAPPIPLLKVNLRATVEIPPNGFLRHQILRAQLDKSVYVAGESARLHISADDDMQIVIANFNINDEIVPLYPNQFVTQNRLQKNTTLTVPGNNAGYEFQLTVAAGHRRHTEAFLIFGFPQNTRSPMPSLTALFPTGQPLEYSDFYNRLTKLPVSWIAEQVLVYEVISN